MRRIEPFFPRSRGLPRVDDRRVISGVTYVIRHGLQWKDAPTGYGPPDDGLAAMKLSEVRCGYARGARLRLLPRQACLPLPRQAASARLTKRRGEGADHRTDTDCAQERAQSILYLDMLPVRRKVKSNELARAVGITESNLSAIQSGKIKGFRFSTMDSICHHLQRRPGGILKYGPVNQGRIEPLSEAG